MHQHQQIHNTQHRYKAKADKKTQQALEIIQRLRVKKEKKKVLQQQQNVLSSREGQGIYFTAIQTSNRVSPQKKKQTSALLINPFDQDHQQRPFDEYHHAQPINYHLVQQQKAKALKGQLQSQKDKNKAYALEIQSLTKELQTYKDIAKRSDQSKKVQRMRQEQNKQYEQLMRTMSQRLTKMQQQNNHLNNLLSLQQQQSIQKMTSLQQQLIYSKSLQQQLLQQLAINNHKLQLSSTLQLSYKQQIQEAKSSIQRYKQKLLIKDEQIVKLTASQQCVSSKEMQVNHMQSIEITQLRKQLQLQSSKTIQLSKQLALVKHYLNAKQQALAHSQAQYENKIFELNQQLQELQKCLQSEHGELQKVRLENEGIKQKIIQSEGMFLRQKRELVIVQEKCIQLEGKLKKVTAQLSIKLNQLQQLQQLSNQPIQQPYLDQFHQCQQQLHIIKQSHQQLKLTHQQLNQAYQKQIKTNLSLTQKIEQLKKRYQKVQAQRQEQLEAFQITIKNVQQGMNQEREQYEVEISTLKGVIKSLKCQLQQLRTNLQIQNKKSSKQQPKSLTSQQPQSTIAKLHQQLLQQRNKYANSSLTLYQQIQALNSQLKTMKEQSQHLQLNNSNLSKQNNQLNAQTTRLEGDIARLKVKRNQLQQKLTKENHQKIFAINQIQRLNQKLALTATTTTSTHNNFIKSQQIQQQKDNKIAQLTGKVQELEKILIEMDDINAELKHQMEKLREKSKQLEAGVTKRDNQLSALTQQLNQMQLNSTSTYQQPQLDPHNRHIKTIQHLTIQLQTAYSEINSLKQSLMKKSHINKIDDSSLFNDSSILDESYVSQCEKQKIKGEANVNNRDYQGNVIKQSLNLLKQPPKNPPTQRVNTLMMGGGNIISNTSKQQSSKQKQKRNGSIKKIAGYFGF